MAQERLSLELGRITSAPQVDLTTQQALAFLRDNLAPVSSQVDRVLSQLSRQTFRVHRAILEQPSRYRCGDESRCGNVDTPTLDP